MHSSVFHSPRSLKIIALLAGVIILSLVISLSVQAASSYIVDNDASVTSYAMTVIDNKPVIAYYDSVTQTIKLAICANAACETGTSTISTVVTTNHSVTVGITNNGGLPFIVYSDPTAKQLRAIACNDLTCSAPDNSLLTNLLNSSSVVEDVIISNGKPLIMYRDVFVDYSQAILKIAACDTTACTTATLSTIHTDVTSDWGSEFRAAYNNGYVLITFIHENQLKMGVCSNLTCTNIVAWRILDIEGLSSLAASKLAITIVNGNPLIVYQAGSSNRIRVAACSDATCSARPTITTHDLQTYQGLAVTMLGSNTVVIASAYSFDTVSWMKLSTCADAVCTSLTTETLAISDYQKRNPKLVNIGGAPVLAYLSTISNISRLNYYFPGEYVPVESPTPSLVPSYTPTPVPPTDEPTPYPTLTPLPPLPTLEPPPTIIPIQSAIGNMAEVQMQLDPQGNPVMLYSAFGNQLYLVRCNSRSCNAPTITTIPNALPTLDYSFVLDHYGFAVISFYDYTKGQMKLLTCNNTICDAPAIRTVDSVGVGWANTVILDDSGIPLISYEYSKNYDDEGIKLARCTNSTCDSATIWKIPDPDLFAIRYMNIMLDTNGIPSIMYYDWGAIKGGIRLARCESATSCDTPSLQKILAAKEFFGSTLDTNGMPVIGYGTTGYYDFLIKVAHCNNTTTCDVPSIAAVDAVPYVSSYAGMAWDTEDRIYLTYEEGGRNDLRLARCNNAQCNAPQIVLIDSTDITGNYSAVAVDGTGQVFIAYTRKTSLNESSDLLLYTGRPFDAPLPTPVTPTAPANAAPQRNFFTTHEPVLTWQQIPGATRYAIQISRQAKFNDSLWVDGTILPSTLEYKTPPLENGMYYWRLKAQRSDGTWGNWSAGDSFLVSAP
ncbi:MAG TPA: hypothetical protein VHO69_15575 [Phototrophicaceae bacterium]|nr:hypothetical protein [Phototrophicaceae bacterium]